MLILSFILFTGLLSTEAILRVQKNEKRDFDLLDGLWTFVREPTNGANIGLKGVWYRKDLSKMTNATVMPVPCAYNDLSAESDLRDHIGWVWYQTKEYVSERDADRKFILRFGSVNYYANVFINGYYVGNHEGGHLPFAFDVTKYLKIGEQNKFTVAVNNTLTSSTIPSGNFEYMASDERNLTDGRVLQRTQPGAFKFTSNFDFFNYAGILRSVHLLKLNPSHINEIITSSDHKGYFSYKINISTNQADEDVRVYIFDENEHLVFETRGLEGKGMIRGVKPWWPRGMGEPTLYKMKVELLRTSDALVLDTYHQTFGFRTVSWTDKQILINDKPFYCLGFGMHEDFEIHGRGFNQAVMTKDLNLLEWMGGNCYRTTHYPYAEERMDEGDRRGIAVIVETPAVGLKGSSNMNLRLHEKMIAEMIMRDRNHPSVIMWSLANEPKTEKKEFRPYFKSLVDFTHAIDKTRPVTVVYGPSKFSNDKTADLMDIICVNRYYGWYIDMGQLDWVNQSVYWDLSLWHDTFKRPILLTEYGADSLPGLNQQPSVDFSEQYQNDILRGTHHALDTLIKDHHIAGEMIWNFADFMTGMRTYRAVGNRKGVFTRTRQAKQSAYILRERYLSMHNQTELPVW